MKVILSLIITCTILSTLSGTSIGYDIGNFRPMDLQEYSLAPYISNNTEYVDVKGYGYGSGQDNGLSLKGLLKLVKPNHELLVSTDDNALMTASKNSNYLSSYYKNSKYGQKSIFYSYDILWQKGLSSSNQIEYRKYNDKHFVGLEFTNSYEYSDSKEKDAYSFSENVLVKYWSLQNSLAAAIGVGRLYECQEAYTAWYFFKELEKNGFLNKQYTAEDIDEIATTLYKLRSLHEIDSRRNYVTKATILMDELKSKEYIRAGTDTKAAATLMELWQQGDKAERLTGTRCEIKPFISITDYVRKDIFEYEDSNTSESMERFYQFDGGMELALRYERPFHNIFQMSSKLSLEQGFYDSFYKEDYDGTTRVNWKPFTHINAYYTISCYPDCRSHISLGMNSHYFIKNLSSAQLSGDYLSFLWYRDYTQQFDTSVALNTNYLITSRLYLNGNISGAFKHMRRIDDFVYQPSSFNASLNLEYRIY